MKMLKNAIKLGFFVFLVFITALTGCTKKDEVKALKEQLAQNQKDVDYWKGRYDAVSEDLKKVKAVRRDLNTRLGSVVDTVDTTSKSVEEQIYQYQQQITDLQAQIQELNSFIDQQDAIIADQEAAFQEFMNMVGQPTTGLIQNPNTGTNPGYNDTGTNTGY